MRKLVSLGFALTLLFILSACDTDTIAALADAVIETELASSTDTPLPPTQEWLVRSTVEWLVRKPVEPPLATPSPTKTPTSALPACPSSPPVAIVLESSYCRSGPSMIYDKLTAYLPGAMLPFSGYYQHPDGNIWWNVNHPITGRDCWIAGTLVDVCTPLDYATLLTPPPTPTQRPVQDDGRRGGLQCNKWASSEAECGDGLWDCTSGPSSCECDCSVLCTSFTDPPSCQAHVSWFCSWNGSACVGPWP